MLDPTLFIIPVTTARTESGMRVYNNTMLRWELLRERRAVPK